MVLDSSRPIFPLQPNKKIPFRKTRGFHDATINQTSIAAWQRQFPNCNWGMPTGQMSGIVVLDLDTKTPGADGLVWWEDQQQKSGRVNTFEVCTPSGGVHLYFRQPKGVRLQSNAGQIAPGVDCRAEGGYVVIPPSCIEGVPYLVINPDASIEEMPRWLLDIWPRQGDRMHGVARTNISKREVGEGAVIPLGQRNVGLAAVAGRLWRKCASAEELVDRLLEYNQQRCQPPLHDHEVIGIAESIARYPQTTRTTRPRSGKYHSEVGSDTAEIDDHYSIDEVQVMLGRNLSAKSEGGSRPSTSAAKIKKSAAEMPDYLKRAFQRNNYSIDEIQQMLGTDIAKGLAHSAARKQIEGKAVPTPGVIKHLTALPSREEKEAGRKRWNALKKRFPVENGVIPLLIRNVCSDQKDGGFIAQTFGHTWRNIANAQNNRRKIGYHLFPRLDEHLSTGGTWNTRSFATAAWTPKFRDSFGQKMRRQDARWIAFDNITEFDEIQVLSSVALDDQWVELDPAELFDLVTGWLDAIWPRTDLSEGASQPHYYWGSDALKQGLTANPEPICDKARLVGILPIGTTTDAELAAALRKYGGRTYYRRAIWKTQFGETLQIERVSPENIARVVAQFGGTLTLFGRGLLEPVAIDEAA